MHKDVVIRAIPVPEDSEIKRHTANADFCDAFEMPLGCPEEPAIGVYTRLVARTPAWVNGLMAFRNRLAAALGLKNLGHLGQVDPHKAPETYKVGDRVGIFSVIYLSEREVILSDSDRHLDVKVSVCKVNCVHEPSMVVSTVVHVHNLLGRVYMLFVGPVHKVIVPAVMRRSSKSCKIDNKPPEPPR